MNSKPIHIKFDKGSAIAVKEPLLNSYGFNLTDTNAIRFTTEKFIFTILGFKPTAQYDRLLVTVKVTFNPHIQDHLVHLDKVDLYIPDRINTYCRTTAMQLNVNVEEVKKSMYSLRERLERYRLDEMKNGHGEVKETPVSQKEQQEAMTILQVDNLMDCIEGLLKEAGIITENKNALLLFLILLSRHFAKPLHVLFQGSLPLSKMLMDIITSTIPVTQVHRQTSMSASAMYYTRDKNYWKNKVLYANQIDKQFKGAGIIKEFIENNVLRRYTTESDYQTRQLHANNKVVEGPICLLGYTEDENLYNKFFQESFFIRLEENETNTVKMLHHLRMQEGAFTDLQQQNAAKRMLMTIQSKIKPVHIVIPHSMEIALPANILNPVRSLHQLLTFIKTVALLHQHQLKKKRDSIGVEYIEATPEHLEIALELFKGIAITQSDVLTPRQRSFLETLKIKVNGNSFKIRETMNAMRMRKSYFYKEFNVLKEQGYIIKTDGDKKSGVEYKIVELIADKELEQSTIILDEQKKEVSTKFPPRTVKGEIAVIISDTG